MNPGVLRALSRGQLNKNKIEIKNNLRKYRVPPVFVKPMGVVPIVMEPRYLLETWDSFFAPTTIVSMTTLSCAAGAPYVFSSISTPLACWSPCLFVSFHDGLGFCSGLFYCCLCLRRWCVGSVCAWGFWVYVDFFFFLGKWEGGRSQCCAFGAGLFFSFFFSGILSVFCCLFVSCASGDFRLPSY